MKLLVHGDVDIPGSGGWFYAETLAEMGHSVLRVSSSEGFDFYSSFTGRVIHKVLGRPLATHRKAHAAKLVGIVRRERPDIVLILKGLSISGSDVEAMRSAGSWVAIINHDDFFSEYRTNWSAVQRCAIPSYDFVFTTRDQNVGEIAPLNPRVEFFPFAYHPRYHRMIDVPDDERETWNVDVVFVGTWEPERCRLLEYLVQRAPGRYAIWGGGWEHAGRRSVLQPHIRYRDVVLDDMCKAIGGARVSLGFLRRKNRDDYTQRTFEIPACNGVLLAERTLRHQSYFKEGVEAEFFDPRCPEELVSKVRGLLADTDRRESIRKAGRSAVLRQRHSYQDRLERLLEVYASAK
jgi:spore maturation protein CgeB